MRFTHDIHMIYTWYTHDIHMIYTWYMYVFVCICPMCRDTKWTATSPSVLHDIKVGPCVSWPPRSSTFIQRSPPCSGRSMKRLRMPSRKPCLVVQKCHFLSNSFTVNICKSNMFIYVCHLHESLKPSDFLLAVRPASNQKGQAHRKTHLKLIWYVFYVDMKNLCTSGLPDIQPDVNWGKSNEVGRACKCLGIFWILELPTLSYFSWNGVGIHVPPRTKLVVQVAYSGKWQRSGGNWQKKWLFLVQIATNSTESSVWVRQDFAIELEVLGQGIVCFYDQSFKAHGDSELSLLPDMTCS